MKIGQTIKIKGEEYIIVDIHSHKSLDYDAIFVKDKNGNPYVIAY